MEQNILSIKDKLFSIKNKGIHKIITVLGIKLKIKAPGIYANVQNNYNKVLKKLKHKAKGEKINIVFVSNEPQKWTYNSLYKKFENSEYFNPIIVVYPLERLNKEEKYKYQNEQYNFFANKGFNVEYGYENGKNLPVKNFNPDIVFYPQPSDKIDENSPNNVSEFALTMYSPYGVLTFKNKNNYKQDFHKFLFAYFCEHELNIKRYETYKKGNSKNCISVGYPKLDEYLEEYYIDKSKYWKHPDKFKIIYAPHHSFKNNGSTHISTFLENGRFILELAKLYSEKTTWIFKPHPRLKYVLKENGYMNESDIEKYWNEWNSIGKIYDSGDYLDIFKSSDLMITDCSSFLIEYLPSMHPLIRLVKKNSLAVNDFCKKCISQYYFANDNIELQNIFEDLVIKKNDYKKEERKELVKEILDKNQSSADKIYNYILKLLEIK